MRSIRTLNIRQILWLYIWRKIKKNLFEWKMENVKVFQWLWFSMPPSFYIRTLWNTIFFVRYKIRFSGEDRKCYNLACSANIWSIDTNPNCNQHFILYLCEFVFIHLDSNIHMWCIYSRWIVQKKNIFFLLFMNVSPSARRMAAKTSI